jgi:hypothetical protein
VAAAALALAPFPAAALPTAALSMAAALAGCGGRGEDAAAVRARARAHLAAFDAFDAWARRAALGDPAFRDDRAFHEAAFAPLRGRAEVGNAWIDRRGPDARLRAMSGADAPPQARWFPLREPGHEPADAAATELPPRGPPGTSGPMRPVLALRRTTALPDGATVTVVVAFLDPPPAQAGGAAPANRP